MTDLDPEFLLLLTFVLAAVLAFTLFLKAYGVIP